MTAKMDYSLYGGAETPFPPATPCAIDNNAADDPLLLTPPTPSSSSKRHLTAASSAAAGFPVGAALLLTPSESSWSSAEDEEEEDENAAGIGAGNGVAFGETSSSARKQRGQQDAEEYFALRRRRRTAAAAAQKTSMASAAIHGVPVPPPSLLTPGEDEELELFAAKATAAAGSSSSSSSSSSAIASDASSSAPDFLWMMTEEPHRSRRLAILKAHPEVRKLMGATRATAPLVLLVVTLQLSLAILLRHQSIASWAFLGTAYALGGALNQNIFLAIHEITHNLAFKSLRANKALAMFANLAIGVPYAMAFKGYHIEHHKFLGEDGIDTDLPSKWEAIILNNVAGKTFFATFQIFFYALRPGFVRSQRPTVWHAINLVVILAADALLVTVFGWKPLLYLLFSSFFAGSLHPCAAHFIAEHYLMNGPVTEGDDDLITSLSQETTSYYGLLNILCYNVGYHNEHHDFPSVPWTRLPELRRIAHEFYDPLPAHKSWPAVTWKFITDPKVGMWSRAKRRSGDKGERIDQKVWMRGGKQQDAASSGGSDESVVSVEDDQDAIALQ